MATQLVSAADKGGILVDASAIGRPVGDTSSSACYVTDLPKNFHGGEEALHWSLGELFGQYGKIKKIELYMEEGILETQNFKGEALIVYHRGKLTGSHDKGDPVWDACTDMDGKYRLLGKKMWRMRVEAATWQREGYDVKDRAKRFPCVEIGNLWEYVPAMPLAWFGEMQEVIRLHAAEHIEMPFVKVEPTEGKATVWCKGAQDAMKFASIMHKSYFLGRKVQTSLCRKPKPVEERLPRLPKPAPGAVTPGGQQRLPELSLKPKAPEPEPAPAPEPTAEPEASAAPAAPAPEVQAASAGPAFQLKGGCRVTLRGLVAKPQNNGLRAEVIEYLAEAERYQVRLEDGRCVKLKRENLEVVREDQAEDARALAAEASEDESDSDEEMEDADGAANAQAAAKMMVDKLNPQLKTEGVDMEFTATVCVDASLLPKREGEEEAPRRRESSRSRERRQQERIAAVKARLEADKGPRPAWIMSAPQEMAAKAGGGADGAPAPRKEPEESREELLKLPVSRLKALLLEFGKSARGCLEKKDFVDRLKPPPKT